MKKLMIAAVAICAAALAQAANVTWNSGTFYTPGTATGEYLGFSSSKVAANSTAYTMTVNFYTSYTAGVLDGKLTVGNTTYDTVGGSSAKYIRQKTTGYDFVSDTDYYVQAVITEKATGATLTSDVMKMTYDGGQVEPTIKFMANTATGGTWGSADGSAYNSTYGWWNSSGWKAASVPEPTSGLLLLIGMAGLALRRRLA